LQHLIHRLVILTRGYAIDTDDLDLPSNGKHHDHFLPFKDAKRIVVEKFEKTYLQQMLTVAGGNISRAAQASGKRSQSILGTDEKAQSPTPSSQTVRFAQ